MAIHFNQPTPPRFALLILASHNVIRVAQQLSSCEPYQVTCSYQLWQARKATMYTHHSDVLRQLPYTRQTMSTNSLNTPTGGYGQQLFTVPRPPCIRIFALKEVYDKPLIIPTVDNVPNSDNEACISFGGDIGHFPITLVTDTGSGGSGFWSTAPIGDFIVNRVKPKQVKREAYIYIGKTGKLEESEFVLYVSSSETEVTTKFGRFVKAQKEPEPFADGGGNYFTDMSDAGGRWLWLYRLYAKQDSKP